MTTQTAGETAAGEGRNGGRGGERNGSRGGTEGLADPSSPPGISLEMGPSTRGGVRGSPVGAPKFNNIVLGKTRTWPVGDGSCSWKHDWQRSTQGSGSNSWETSFEVALWRRPRVGKDDGVENNDAENPAARALQLTQMGELSSARQAPSPVAPGNESTRVKLVGENRRPSQPRRRLDRRHLRVVDKFPPQFEDSEKRCSWRSLWYEWRTSRDRLGESRAEMFEEVVAILLRRMTALQKLDGAFRASGAPDRAVAIKREVRLQCL